MSAGPIPIPIPVWRDVPSARFRRRRWRGHPLIVRPGTGDPLAIALAPLADPAFVRSLLADEPIRVRNGDASALLTGETAGETSATTYGAFVDQLGADPASKLVCSELATPAPLAARTPPPAFVFPDDGDPLVVAEDDDDRTSDMFLAGPGAVAHLHYDGDLRDVVMLQLFGHKRYVLIDPIHSAKVLPLTGSGVQRTSGVFLEHLGEDDLAAFLRYTEAQECVLGPGDILFMPAGWWHYVEYLDVSLSVNHRLGRTPELRTLAEQVPVPSVEWQALAQLYRDPDLLARSTRLRAAWAQVEQALADTAPLLATDPVGRAAMLERLCFDLCAELDEPVARPPATMIDLRRRTRLTSAPLVSRAPEPSRPPAPPEVSSMPAPDADAPTPAPAPAAVPDADAVPDARAWTAATSVQVPDGSALFVPVQSPGLALAQGDHLVALMPPDPEHHWTLPVLTRIARQPGVTVAALATASDVPAAHVLAFLVPMAAAGWVAEVG